MKSIQVTSSQSTNQSAKISVKKFGGRDRDRTSGPLLAKVDRTKNQQVTPSGIQSAANGMHRMPLSN
jgi:cobalamin biosynthesis protein CbiD